MNHVEAAEMLPPRRGPTLREATDGVDTIAQYYDIQSTVDAVDCFKTLKYTAQTTD